MNTAEPPPPRLGLPSRRVLEVTYRTPCQTRQTTTSHWSNGIVAAALSSAPGFAFLWTDPISHIAPPAHTIASAAAAAKRLTGALAIPHKLRRGQSPLTTHTVAPNPPSTSFVSPTGEKKKSPPPPHGSRRLPKPTGQWKPTATGRRVTATEWRRIASLLIAGTSSSDIGG